MGFNLVAKCWYAVPAAEAAGDRVVFHQRQSWLLFHQRKPIHQPCLVAFPLRARKGGQYRTIPLQLPFRQLRGMALEPIVDTPGLDHNVVALA